MRVQVRPSGTEPKVKLYGEAVDADRRPRRPPRRPRRLSPRRSLTRFGSVRAGSGTNRFVWGRGRTTERQRVRASAVITSSWEPTSGPAIGRWARTVVQRGLDVDAEQHQEGDGGGARRGRCRRRSARRRTSPSLQSPREIVEERAGRRRDRARSDRGSGTRSHQQSCIGALTVDRAAPMPLVEPRHVSRLAIRQLARARSGTPRWSLRCARRPRRRRRRCGACRRATGRRAHRREAGSGRSRRRVTNAASRSARRDRRGRRAELAVAGVAEARGR